MVKKVTISRNNLFTTQGSFDHDLCEVCMKFVVRVASAKLRLARKWFNRKKETRNAKNSRMFYSVQQIKVKCDNINFVMLAEVLLDWLLGLFLFIAVESIKRIHISLIQRQFWRHYSSNFRSEWMVSTNRISMSIYTCCGSIECEKFKENGVNCVVVVFY